MKKKSLCIGRRSRAVLVVVVAAVVLSALETIISHDLLVEGCASNLLYYIAQN
jgi:regulator of extracellular matrix RemA (YlzA/DUF370 family)